jgi:hypothetical protein
MAWGAAHIKWRDITAWGAAHIKWGDVPTWVAAIGTTGTLITGTYIILRDRMNQYRVQFDELMVFVRVNASSDEGDSYMTLTAMNRSWANFYDLDIYAQTIGYFEDGQEKPIGFHCFREQALMRREYKSQPIFRQVRGVSPNASTILVWRATDQVGRTWLKERKKPAKMVTWRNRLFVRRKLKRLKRRIKRAVRERFIEELELPADASINI